MDDYRDLVMASFALAFAGIMLVAGQLYIEHHPIHPASRPVDSPQQQPQTSPALISHAPPPREHKSEPRQGVGAG
jgi:hypothetical protein